MLNKKYLKGIKALDMDYFEIVFKEMEEKFNEIQNNPKKNDLCWCGSKQLYKKCHASRHKEKKLYSFEIKKRMHNIFNAPKGCSYHINQDCNRAIKSHTIQKSGVLSKMAFEGKVGSFYKNEDYLDSNKNTDLKSGIKKQASIFYGFCHKHDTELFREIETNQFKFTYKNCWASSYRAICHEHYQKNAGQKSNHILQNILDNGKTPDQQLEIQKKLFVDKISFCKGLESIKSIKNKYEDIHKTESYNDLTSYLLIFDESPTFATCGTFSPFFDINGNWIQNKGNPRDLFEHIAVSTVMVGGCVGIVLSHLKSHSIVGKYLEEVLSYDYSYIKTWLINMVFCHIENTYFSLEWWNSLKNDTQTNIFKFSQDGCYTKQLSIEKSISSHVPNSLTKIYSSIVDE